MSSSFGRSAVVRGGALVGSGAIISALAGATITFVLARQLGPTGLGQYSVVIATSGLLATIGRFGQGPILIQRLAHTSPGSYRRPVVAAFTTMIAASTALILVISTPLGATALQRSAGITGDEKPLLVVLFVATSGYALASEAFRGLQRFALASYSGVLMQRILLLLMLGLSVAMLLPSLSPYRAVVLASVTATMTLFVSTLVLGAILRGQGSFMPVPHTMVNTAREGLPLVLAGVIAVVAARIPLWIFANSDALDQAGIFALAAAMAAALALIPQIAINTLGPFVASAYASGDRTGISHRLGLIAAGLTLVTLVAALAILLAGLYLAQIAVGSGFAPAVPTFAILAVGVVTVSVTGPCGLVLKVTGFQQWNLVASAAGALLAVFAVLALAPTHGAFGAAIGVVAASIFQNVLLMIFARSHAAVRTNANFGALWHYLLDQNRRVQ